MQLREGMEEEENPYLNLSVSVYTREIICFGSELGVCRLQLVVYI